MKQGPLAQQIIAAYDGMSAQLQTAARFVLDNPGDVALLSMREQARRAGVQPATMTRLAKYLGLDGYDSVRERYGAAMRDGAIGGFSKRATAQVASQKVKGDKALALDMAHTLSQQIDWLSQPETLDRLTQAADILVRARRVYALGLRASHAAAWHLHYMLTLISEKSALLDGIAQTGADPLAHARPEDALFVVSVQPYTRMTVELADYAATLGLSIIAVTDSEVSPLAQRSTVSIIVPTGSPSFFHAMTPSVAVAEILGAIIAGRGGDEALSALRQTDGHLAALHTHFDPKPVRRAL